MSVLRTAVNNVVNNIIQEERLSEAKNTKVHCRSHNPYKDKDGRFTDPGKNAGSFSMKKADGPEGCSWGKSSRKSASRTRTATKLPCGRGEKHRCKDGTPKWESELSFKELISDAESTGDVTRLELYLSGIIKRAIQQTLSKINKRKEHPGNCSFRDLLRFQNTVAQADKGKL